MDEQARISHILAAVRLLSPLVFHRKLIILVTLLGTYVTTTNPGNVNDTVLHGKNTALIFRTDALQPCGETTQVLDLEELDTTCGNDGLRNLRR